MTATLENKTKTAKYFPYQISALCLNIPKEIWDATKDRVLEGRHMPRRFRLQDNFPKYFNFVQETISLLENLDKKTFREYAVKKAPIIYVINPEENAFKLTEKRIDELFHQNKLERLIESGKTFLRYFQELDQFVQEEAPSIAADEDYQPKSAMISHKLNLTPIEKRIAEILNVAMHSKVDNKQFYRLNNFIAGVETMAAYIPAFFDEFFDQKPEHREIFTDLTKNVAKITSEMDYDRLLFLQKSGNVLGPMYGKARMRSNGGKK